MGKQSHKSYERIRGNREAVPQKEITISFSWTKLDPTQGQTIDNWEKEGLLSKLCKRLQQIGQFSSKQVLAQQLIKQYTQVGFPENSKFREPKHVNPPMWAVIHITPTSKEVVAGFIEDNIFFIVFLDKEHHFWPSNIQDRGKVRR